MNPPTTRTNEPLRARIGRKVAEVKAPYASFLALKRLFRSSLFEYANMYVLTLELSLCEGPDPDGPSIREVTAADASDLERLDEPRDAVLGRFARGQRVWVFEQDGRILAFDWIAGAEKTLSDWLIVEGAPGAFWGHFLKVQADCRGMGLGPRLRRQVCREYARAGYCRLLSTVDTGNRNSLSFQLKAGAQPFGQIRFFSLLGVTLLRHGRRRRLGRWNARYPLRIALEDTARPGLTVEAQPR